MSPITLPKISGEYLHVQFVNLTFDLHLWVDKICLLFYWRVHFLQTKYILYMYLY